MMKYKQNKKFADKQANPALLVYAEHPRSSEFTHVCKFSILPRKTSVQRRAHTPNSTTDRNPIGVRVHNTLCDSVKNEKPARRPLNATDRVVIVVVVGLRQHKTSHPAQDRVQFVASLGGLQVAYKIGGVKF